jgi:hypothetical protein
MLFGVHAEERSALFLSEKAQLPPAADIIIRVGNNKK